MSANFKMKNQIEVMKDPKKRHEDVLAIIVRRYVETAEPVGSRFVSRKLGLSSATIRNVMADLEDMGLITQPHTSAGRAPTDRGYRYYIDSLMRIKSINDQTRHTIQEEYDRTLRSIEDVMERTSHLVSHLTNYVGITMLDQYDKLYLDGASHIIEQPEFNKDLRKLHSIIKFLEEKRELLALLRNDFAEEHLVIHIGKETGFSYLHECSIVTRGYKVKGKVSGKVGVIGPKRMVYEKVIPTVEILADTVTDIIERFGT